MRPDICFTLAGKRGAKKVECYQNGAYPQGAEPDFDMEDKIMNKYGIVIEQQ